MTRASKILESLNKRTLIAESKRVDVDAWARSKNLSSDNVEFGYELPVDRLSELVAYPKKLMTELAKVKGTFIVSDNDKVSIDTNGKLDTPDGTLILYQGNGLYYVGLPSYRTEKVEVVETIDKRDREIITNDSFFTDNYLFEIDGAVENLRDPIIGAGFLLYGNHSIEQVYSTSDGKYISLNEDIIRDLE